MEGSEDVVDSDDVEESVEDVHPDDVDSVGDSEVVDGSSGANCFRAILDFP